MTFRDLLLMFLIVIGILILIGLYYILHDINTNLAYSRVPMSFSTMQGYIPIGNKGI